MLPYLLTSRVLYSCLLGFVSSLILRGILFECYHYGPPEAVCSCRHCLPLLRPAKHSFVDHGILFRVCVDTAFVSCAMAIDVASLIPYPVITGFVLNQLVVI